MLESTTAQVQTTFDDDIATAVFVIGEFRDLLHAETAKIMQDKIDKPEGFDPARHAHLHRMRVAADNFLGALSGQY
jgi:hypothetical protein